MQCVTTPLPQTTGASTPGTKHIHNEHVQRQPCPTSGNTPPRMPQEWPQSHTPLPSHRWNAIRR